MLYTLATSYTIGYLSFSPVVARHDGRRLESEVLTPEVHLNTLIYHVVLLPIGLLFCTFVATVLPLHWAGVAFASVLVGIASFAIYYATIGYVVEVYGPYAASATGGNGSMRDLLAGMCALNTGSMCETLSIQNSYFVLFALALVFCIPVYVFYFKVVAIKRCSKVASNLADEKKKKKHEINPSIDIIWDETLVVPVP